MPQTTAWYQSRIKEVRQSRIKTLIRHNPKPSLNDLDNKLSRYLNYSGGFFIELGGNDGYTQSNTFFLEYQKNWKGILIEGIPDLARSCKYFRMNSQVFNCACVDFNYPNSHITMQYAGLMSIVNGAMKSPDLDQQHIKKGLSCQNISNPYSIQVPTRTLQSIIDECSTHEIDFLSLDVEGFESNVLNGIDFNKNAPKYICVEARHFEDVHNILQSHYSIIEQLTHHDYLYRRN